MQLSTEASAIQSFQCTDTSRESVLRFSEKDIRKNARRRFADHGLFGIVLKQAFYENLLKVRKHVNFRHRENTAATQAYCAMSLKEFDGINARQNWANWRTVPRNLSGRLPNRPIFAIDLCSGMGHSTEVLAFYLPLGSKLLGLEYNPQFVEVARTRSYRDSNHREVQVEFHAQSVLDPFMMADGTEVPSDSVDLVNCCGAVGHHFDPEATEKLADQVQRVVMKGGLVLLDSGKDGTPAEALIRIMGARGFRQTHAARSCILDHYTQICFVRD